MSNALTGNERISILGNTTQTSVSLKELQGESGGVTAEELDQRLATFRSDLSGFDVGLGDVDNTSDADKPISTATQAALDKKVNLAGLLGTINSASATVHTGETQVDVFKLPYGQHLIRTNNALNTPPDTTITLIEVIKTHDEVGGGTGIVVLTQEDFEQGTISESSAVGTDYNLAKYPPTEPLHGSRIRNINPIPINEFSTISVAEGYQYCVLAFDENQKYLGRSTFMPWASNPRLTFPDARYIAVAVKHFGVDSPITPSEATQAKLTITTLGSASGGSKLLIAWGATQGDLHTCVNIAGAWSAWRKIGTQLPQDAIEGSTLKYIGGAWVAVPPEVTP